MGAPPGFSDGDQWVIPLIGPLEDGLLLVPALVNGQGPYVFAIDSDAHVSIIDRQVVDEVKPRTGEGPRMLDESDTQQNRFYGEILSWQLGTLTVKGPKPAQIVGKGTFDAGGRRIHGVIGRDIIAESLVFELDRDLGTITLTTQKAFTPPFDAKSFTYSNFVSRIPYIETLPLPRRLVTASIAGQSFQMHVDFGAIASQLRPRSWARAKIAAEDVQLSLPDEVGILRLVKQKGRAEAVTVGDVTTKDVVFVPYGDERWPDQYLEGALGLGFFKPYTVTANWDDKRIYVAPRPSVTRDTIARIGRWQSKTLSGCEDTGCVKISVVDPLAGKPPEERPAKHPGLVLSVVRDRSAAPLDLEVLIAAAPAEGKPALQWLVANLPAGSDRAMIHLSDDYVDASFAVLDAGLFPRTCPAQGSCIDRIEASSALSPAALPDAVKAAAPAPTTAPAPAAGGALEVPPSVLEANRVAGEPTIVPDDLTKHAIGQAKVGRVVALVKLCLDESGAVDQLAVVESSGFADYDQKLLRRIRETWRFKPYLVDDKPAPVCTQLTFIYTQK